MNRPVAAIALMSTDSELLGATHLFLAIEVTPCTEMAIRSRFLTPRCQKSCEGWDCGTRETRCLFLTRGVPRSCVVERNGANRPVLIGRSRVHRYSTNYLDKPGAAQDAAPRRAGSPDSGHPAGLQRVESDRFASLHQSRPATATVIASPSRVHPIPLLAKGAIRPKLSELGGCFLPRPA